MGNLFPKQRQLFGNSTKKGQTKFDHRDGSTMTGIRKIIVKVRETGFIVDAFLKTWAVRTSAKSVLGNPSTSTRYRSQELNISCSSIRRILRKDINITPYKVQLVQTLKPHHPPLRMKLIFNAVCTLISKICSIFGSYVVITSDWLVRLVEQRHHWSIFLWEFARHNHFG